MTKKKKRIIASVLLVLAVICVWKYRSHSTPPAIDATLVQASAVKELPMPIEIHAIGSLVAAHNIEITAEMPGHIVKILFHDGAFVDANTPLFQLNDAAYKTKYQAANARLIFIEGKFKRVSMLAKKVTCLSKPWMKWKRI